MPGARPVPTLAGRVAALPVSIAFGILTVAAQQGAADVTFKITKTDGAVVSLTKVAELRSFEDGGFNFSLTVAVLKDLVRQPDGRFIVTRVTGESLAMAVAAPAPGATREPDISGQGEFGTTRVPWSLVSRIEILQPASVKASGAPRPAVFQIRSRAGRTIEATTPPTLDWNLQCRGFLLRPDVTRLRSLESAADGTLTLRFEDGVSVVASGVKERYFAINTNWGMATIKFENIEYLGRLSADASPRAESGRDEAPARTARVTLTSGEVLAITKVSGPSLFTSTDTKIEIDPRLIGSIVAADAPGRFRIDGQDTLTGPRDPLIGTVPFGTVTVPWNGVSKTEGLPTLTPRQPPADHARLVTTGGESYVVWNVSMADEAAVALQPAGLSLVSLNIERLTSIARQGDVLTMTFSAGEAFEIAKGGALSASTTLGRLSITLPALTSLTRAKPPAASATTAPRTRVTLTNDAVLRAREITISGSGEHVPDGFWQLRKDGLRYWVATALALRDGLSVAAGAVSADHFGAREEFDGGGFHLDVTTDDGKFRVAAPALKHVDPQPVAAPGAPRAGSGVPRPPPPARGAAPAVPAARLVIEITPRTGAVRTFDAAEVRFANYPTKAWTGSYQVKPVNMWPFQWQFTTALAVTGAGDQSTTAIDIDKLAAIVIDTPRYTGRLRVRSTNDNELVGSQVVTNLNADTRRGPSDLSLTNAGVIITLDSQRKVLVPFEAVSSIVLRR